MSQGSLPFWPGPLAVASLLDADIGRMLIINSIVGVFAVTGGVLWAKLFCSKFLLPFDEKNSSDTSEQKATSENISEKKSPLLMDLLPIIAPILLMGTGAFIDSDRSSFGRLISFLSIPMVAVLIGAGIAMIAGNFHAGDKQKIDLFRFEAVAYG